MPWTTWLRTATSSQSINHNGTPFHLDAGNEAMTRTLAQMSGAEIAISIYASFPMVRPICDLLPTFQDAWS